MAHFFDLCQVCGGVGLTSRRGITLLGDQGHIRNPSEALL